MERTDIVTFKGNRVTLVGTALKRGDRAPDFRVTDKDLKEVTLKDFKGKVKLISVVTSLDTSVCDSQLRKFNEEASSLARDVAVLNISMDLPFAIGRFCATAGINRVLTCSDHRDASFGKAYGVLIKEFRLLARSVFVIDRDDRIVYMEIVPEVTGHVKFEKALEEAKALLSRKTA
ncbi:MAG: thiol peroxidase [Thermodesulfobacteriota bacterium]